MLQGEIRDQFPILNRQVNGKPLVYFDNAASSQKPVSVLEAMDHYYRNTHSNVHRGVHTLSQEATNLYEGARKKVAEFIGANPQEVIFTRGATESINLVANAYGRANIKAGDEILISGMEHHANIVPWQMLCEQVGASLKVIPYSAEGELDLEAFAALLTEKTRLVGVCWASNSLGTINPVREIIAAAHKIGAKVLVDAAQAIHHIPMNVHQLDCDFLVFSSHKMYGPTGIGILYGKEEILQAMPPWQGGGDMIKEVKFSGTTYNEIPLRFEAGTPSIAEAIGLGAAVDFIQSIGLEAIAAHEHALLQYATEKMRELPEMRFFGQAKEKVSVISFLVGNHHPYDFGVLLDQMGIAIRTGHHCTQPIMDHFGIPGTCRASFAVYNTREEVDYFLACLNKVIRMVS